MQKLLVVFFPGVSQVTYQGYKGRDPSLAPVPFESD